MNLPEARALFHRWLATPRRHKALDALCLVTRLGRNGYTIRNPELDAPWCLVHAGRIVAVERGAYPLAVLATGRRASVVAEPARVIDNSERLSGPLVFGERKAGAWRWYAMQERMRAVGEAADAA